MNQPVIHLSVRVSLVKLDTVIAARAESAEMIYTHIDKGRLRWVFNLASNVSGGIRDLRFWSREVTAFGTAKAKGRDNSPQLVAIRRFPVQYVVDDILGPDQEEFHAGEVCLLLGIRRPTLMLLRDELLTAGLQFYHRHSLERFLIRRLRGIVVNV